MRLVMAIINKTLTDPVLDSLTEHGFRATRLASTGGFRREGNTTLIIGVDDEHVSEVLDLLRKTVREKQGANAKPGTGAGALFVLPMTDFVQL